VTAPPYQSSWARIPFWALFGLFVLGEYAMRLRTHLNRSGTRAEGWSLLVVVLGVVAGIFGGLGLANWSSAMMRTGRWAVFTAGLVLMASGLTVRHWSIITLGRFFTADVRVHPDQPVVDRGPYRWVRHPSYSGMIMFFVGLGLALTNWMSLLILALLPTTGLVVRIRSEERALTNALGDPYRRYAAGHKRLLPGVW
jgi:protein-S-isoprenylcysteine O-methyltransferase Ste14